MNEDYFIEPVATSFPEDAAAQPHRIYKRHAPEHPGEQDKKQPAAWAACGVQGIVSFLIPLTMNWQQLDPRIHNLSSVTWSTQWKDKGIIANP